VGSPTAADAALKSRHGSTGDAGVAARYAASLLASLVDSLGCAAAPPEPADFEHPALAWLHSGLMELTGSPDGVPLMCPAPLAACAEGALEALFALAGVRKPDDLRAAPLLSQRARIAGYRRAGRVSPGGSCRLVEAADGWVAVNLAREDDWALVPAWLEIPPTDAWPVVEAAVRRRPLAELVARAGLLGLAVAASPPVLPPVSTAWFRAARPMSGARAPAHAGRVPRVVDLSSLWAGPLCGQLLRGLGAEVTKVESRQRPDGARRGPPEFFAALNNGKRPLELDLASGAGRAQLAALLHGADIVIEASRPRALRQLGIDAEAITADCPGLTWVSLTGYGRDPAQENRIAYGDDAGVAAGLSSLMAEVSGERVICGDAIADPLTGLHAALAAWAGWRQGGAGLLSVALRDVVSHCAVFELPATAEGRIRRQREWTALAREVG
jgi:hypothetical protein